MPFLERYKDIDWIGMGTQNKGKGSEPGWLIFAQITYSKDWTGKDKVKLSNSTSYFDRFQSLEKQSPRIAIRESCEL